MSATPNPRQETVAVHQCDNCGALHVTVDGPVPESCEDCGGSRVVPPRIAVKDVRPRRPRARISGPLPGTILGVVGVVLTIAGAVALPPAGALAGSEGQAAVLNADAVGRALPPAVVMTLGVIILIGVELGGASA